jgi:hypothetical protein
LTKQAGSLIKKSFEERGKRQGIGTVESQSGDLSYLNGLDFWIWDKERHYAEYKRTEAIYGKGKPRCCFNHAIPAGLPQKYGEAKPLFPYEQDIYNALMIETGDIQKDKHVYVLKAVGLGITEFCLRWIAWMCTKDDKFKGSQVVIITAPSILVATSLIKRLKGLFSPDVNFVEKETDCTLNNVSLDY